MGKLLQTQLQTAGFDLGKIQNVVDQLQKMAGIALDMRQEALLLFVQRTGVLLREQLRESEDGVQRSPQLVTHAGQKFALQPIGPLYFLVPQRKLLIRRCELRGAPLQTLIQHPNLLFGPAPLADVAKHAHHVPRFRFRLWQRAQIDVDRELRAILADGIQIESGPHRPAYRMSTVMGAMSEMAAAKSLWEQSFHR